MGLPLFCLLSVAVGYFLAERYVPRLAQHGGYFLVNVEDRLPSAQRARAERPRHTVFVLLDGLRADFAARMATMGALRRAGQCRRTDVGFETVSRPVYAVLSTGLEQDRTGVRNNANESPITAHSFWQSAHDSGLRVTAVAELPWFGQLFSGAFDEYRLVDRAADHFTPVELSDLTLISPIYIDEAAHDHGARSPQYADAVARADREMARLLSRLDLTQDLIVVTADHGHCDRGGHGAISPEVAHVLTCMAGRGVARRADLPDDVVTLDARTVAPTMSVLLGVPLPRNLRAGMPDREGRPQDDLDRIWDIVDPAALGAEYVTDRRAAIDRFRRENSAQLQVWRGAGATWDDLVHAQRSRQAQRALFFFAAICVLCLPFRRHILPSQPGYFLAWLGLNIALLIAIYTALRGSFDMTSVNQRADFILGSSVACVITWLCTAPIHWRVFHQHTRLRDDQLRVTAILLVCNLAHVVAYGWPLGYPLPTLRLFFFPLIGGVALVWSAIFSLVLTLIPAPRTTA